MLTGNYTVPQIQKIANEKWGFRVKKTKKLPERPVSRSGLYRMFSSIFYTGMFFHKGELIENGQHKPMITLQEFDRVQEILGKKGKPRPRTRQFPFNGAIRCGECGSAICGEIKKEKYTFYHCICRDKKNKCSQKKWTKAEDLELQIKKEIDSFTILPEFRDWALAVARELHAKETEIRSDIYETQHKTLTSCQAQLDKLVDMKLQDQLTDDEYNTKRNLLLKQINEMEKRLKDTQNRAKDWLKGMETVFNFATNAHGHFIKGDYETKRKILLALGSNFLLKDGKLSIEANPLLIPIKKDCLELEKKYIELELDKTLTTSEKKLL